MNYNSDMTHEDTPLHITGLEHLVEDQPQDYIGKAPSRPSKRRASIASSSGSSGRATS